MDMLAYFLGRLAEGGAGGAGGANYKSITYNDDDTITLIEEDGAVHTMVCTYDDSALTSVSYDGKPIDLHYTSGLLDMVGKTEVDLSNAKTTGPETALDHTVIFMSEGDIHEITSVKNGNLVNAPVTEPTSVNGVFVEWQIDGTKVDFPYTPMSDIAINAFICHIEENIYRHYGISKDDYPYLEISFNSSYANTRVDIKFAKEIRYASTAFVQRIYYTECLHAIGTTDATFDNHGDIEAAGLFAIDTVEANFSSRDSWEVDDSDELVRYINFDNIGYKGTVYTI